MLDKASTPPPVTVKPPLEFCVLAGTLNAVATVEAALDAFETSPQLKLIATLSLGPYPEPGLVIMIPVTVPVPLLLLITATPVAATPPPAGAANVTTGGAM